MTTIAADLKGIAADSRVCGDYLEESIKIFRVKGSLYGIAGDLTALLAFIDWRRNPRKPKPDLGGDSEILELNPKGIWYWDKHLRPVRCARPYAAIGSGACYAITALRLGKSPKQAVEIAAEFDQFTAPPVLVEKL